MKQQLSTRFVRQFLALLIAASPALTLPAQAGQVALATSPLATSSTSSVAPNIMYMLDDSGSMDWDYMPDTAKNFAGKYGFNSSQCNGVAYNPSITYLPPVDSSGTSYPNSSFTAAVNDGFAGATASGTTDLSTAYPGGSGSGASGSNLATPQAAFYYKYTGTQNTPYLQNYYNTNSTFYKECNSSFGTTPGTSIGSSPGVSVFTFVQVSSTSGPGGTDERTNFANWFSYYSTRMMMMKTGVGQAFRGINPSYRVGFMTMNNNVSPDFINILPFTGGCAVGSGTCQKDQFYTKLYQANPGSSTPLRQTLSQIGNLYANKYATTYSYTATITVSGGGSSSSVTSVAAGPSGCTSATATTGGPCFELMNAPSSLVSSSFKTNNKIATNIAGQINTQNTAYPTVYYTASASGSVVTINGDAADLGTTPVVTATGGGTFTVTSFVQNTVVAKLNNVVPLDPVQYSCQKNFVILSTDGYWNGSAGYDLNGNMVGNQDGTAPRPYFDGAKVSQTTSQVAMTQSQETMSTSQLIQPFESSTSKLTMTSYPLQQQNWQLQSRTKSGGSWGSWGNASSCTYTSSVHCRYVTGTLTSPVATCTNSPKTTSTANNTSYNASAVTCSYSTSGTVTYPSSCTVVSQSSGPTYSGPAVSCSYTAWSAYAGTNSCTTVNQDTTAYNMTATAGVATQCLTNVPTASCASGTTCTTATTGPTYVASTGGTFNCSPGTSGSPNYITTSCAANNLFGPAYVASCSPSDSSSSNSYVMTTCNTTSSSTTVTSCTGQTPNSGNNYTTISCSAGSGGTSDTLADTAMYYYQTDLRSPALSNCTGALGAGTDVCDNNVPISGTDTNPAQHLTTFTLGIGTRGQMVYSSTYKTDTSGDYFSVAQGLSADSTQTPPVCSWQSNGTTCNWPVPASNTYTNIDDLWHTAVNGRGSYFAATDPNTLAKGLASTLAAINQVTGAAAAAATSTLNPVTGNNYAYVASYTTVKWTGNLEQRTIDVTNGNVSTTASWCVENISPPTCVSPGQVIADTSGGSTVYYCSTPATDINGDGAVDALDCTAPQVFDSATTACKAAINNTCVGTLPPMVSATGDTRTIYTANSTGTALIPFDASYAAANPANFSAAHISGLSQWSSFTPAQQTAAAGTNLINYLRGQNGYEENRTSNPVANWLYRDRNAVMGDALESQPTFIAAPTFSYSDPGYSSFVTANASRPGTVYIGTNDGMLHAFAASNGVERWAYVPSAVIPNMWHLADFNYGSQHVNFVNGSPVVSDICTANCTNAATAVWRTIIVGGLNAGGREYYALDITDPTAPSLLWEFTPAIDANLGYSFGRPVVTKLQNGTWVVLVSSGYDNGTLSADNLTANSPAGDGMGHLYVLNAATGSIISNISDNTGSAATPSGFAKFNAYSAVAGTNQAGLVYGGDLLGNVWRFDINTAATPFKFAVLKDPSGATQPITVAPTLGAINGVNIIFVGTGKYLEAADLGNTQVQTIYGIEDNNVTTTFNNPAGSPRSSTTLVQQTLSAATNGVRTDTNNAVSMPPASGWYVDLPDTGERANVDFQLVQGTLLVPTIVPSNTACSPGGYGYLNFFNYQTGGPPSLTSNIVSQYYNSPIVGMNVLFIGGQPMVEIVTSNNPTPTPPPTQPPFQQGSGGFTQTREVWRELIP
jgi:type IV pilus assembly protein PilY1